MTLLAAITNPSSAPAAVPAHPIVLTPGAPPPLASSALPTQIPPSDWCLCPADPDLLAAASFFAASISPSAPLTGPRFRTLVNSFLTTLSLSLSLPAPSPNLPIAIRGIAAYFPATLAPLVASAAARLAEYDVLTALIDSRIIPRPSPDLLPSLDEAARPDLICAVLRQASDLRSSDLLAALRCFLSPASDKAYDAMVGVKRRWADAAVLAVDLCREMDAGKQVKQAALLLMMGHDGFTSPEVCLHYLLALTNVPSVDSVVLAAAVAELDGDEVASLMRYLAKWIGKYQRFPEAQPCPGAAAAMGLEQCDSVPSFGAVARTMGLVLDEHFSHLVLNAEVREELRAAEMMVRKLSAEAESSGPILDLLRRLKQNA